MNNKKKTLDFAKLQELVIAYLKAHDKREAFEARTSGTRDPEEGGEVFMTRRADEGCSLLHAVDVAREALRDALKPTGPLRLGDRVRPTAEARKFLAEGVIKDPSTVAGVLFGDTGVAAAAVRLDPPTRDFAPGGGVPAKWLERIFP